MTAVLKSTQHPSYPYAFKNAFLFRLATMLPHLLLRSQPIGSATPVARNVLRHISHLNARKYHNQLQMPAPMSGHLQLVVGVSEGRWILES